MKLVFPFPYRLPLPRILKFSSFDVSRSGNKAKQEKVETCNATQPEQVNLNLARNFDFPVASRYSPCLLLACFHR